MRRHPSARILPVSALVLLLVGLLALPALAAQEVRLTDDGFSPRTVRVDPGEDIVWINATDEVQTVVGEDGTWDSGPLQPGETFSVALRQSGTVRYATADGEAEGQIRVRPAADEVASEGDDDEAATDEDEDQDEPTGADLPNTGEPAGILLGVALLLVGFGIIALHRADALRVRATAVGR